MDDVWATARGRRAELAVLHRTARGQDPILSELANEVLNGRHTLRDMAFSSAYAEEFHQRMAPLLDRWQRMSESEREDAVTNAGTYNRELLEHFEAMAELPIDEPEHPVPPPAEPDEEDFSQRTYLRRQ
jgi:hypothetical protein